MDIKEQAYHLQKNGLSYKQIGNKLGISKTAAFDYVKEIKLRQGNIVKTPVPNGSEPGMNDRSERKNTLNPDTNKPSLDQTNERTIEPRFRIDSEQGLNERSEHDNLQKPIAETGTEKPDSPIPNVKTFRGDDLIKKEFIIHDFSNSVFGELIGNPSKPFHGFIYGLPKSGKSYGGIFFADYFQEYHGKVCYVAAEEGESVTLQKKFMATNGSKVTILPTRDREIIRNFIASGNWDLVIIDSINNAGIDSAFLEELKQENPGLSTLTICQSTKAGNFKGDQSLTHNCDFIIEVVDGIAKHEGRFNSNSQIEIFKEPLYQKNTARTDWNSETEDTVSKKTPASVIPPATIVQEPISDSVSPAAVEIAPTNELLLPKPTLNKSSILNSIRNFGNMEAFELYPDKDVTKPMEILRTHDNAKKLAWRKRTSTIERIRHSDNKLYDDLATAASVLFSAWVLKEINKRY